MSELSDAERKALERARGSILISGSPLSEHSERLWLAARAFYQPQFGGSSLLWSDAEPTEAEVEAAARAIYEENRGRGMLLPVWDRGGSEAPSHKEARRLAVTALNAARKARGEDV